MADSEMSFWGLTADDYSDEVIIWHENYTAFNVFEAMSTQWRVSMNGYTGLDYNALPTVLNMLEVPTTEHSELFADLRIMERAALTEINKKD